MCRVLQSSASVRKNVIAVTTGVDYEHCLVSARVARHEDFRPAADLASVLEVLDFQDLCVSSADAFETLLSNDCLRRFEHVDLDIRSEVLHAHRELHAIRQLRRCRVRPVIPCVIVRRIFDPLPFEHVSPPRDCLAQSIHVLSPTVNGTNQKKLQFVSDKLQPIWKFATVRATKSHSRAKRGDLV